MAASTPTIAADDFELLASRVDEAIAALRTLDPRRTGQSQRPQELDRGFS